MHFEFDFPTELKWLGQHWFPEIADIGGLSKPAGELVRSINPTGRGLDIGCGTGHFALQLARDTRLKMLGIEIYEPFVLRARAQAKSESLDCVFENGDARLIIRQDGFRSAFSVVIALASGDIFDDTVTTASQVFHTIRKGGYFLVGWIAGKHAVDMELMRLSHHVEHYLGSNVVSVFTEDSVFDFEHEEARSNEMVAFDAGRLSQDDANRLRIWARKRLNDMRASHGRVSTKAILLAEKL